jgi:hypothetical protein
MLLLFIIVVVVVVAAAALDIFSYQYTNETQISRYARVACKLSIFPETDELHLTNTYFFSQIQGPFAKFKDSPYYSDSDLCGGAVTVSFLKYLL